MKLTGKCKKPTYYEMKVSLSKLRMLCVVLYRDNVIHIDTRLLISVGVCQNVSNGMGKYQRFIAKNYVASF